MVLMPVLVSPMHEDGSPDQEGYARLLDYLFSRTRLPVCGVLGSGSENFTMPHAHRVEANQDRGRAHAGAHDPDRRLQ